MNNWKRIILMAIGIMLFGVSFAGCTGGGDNSQDAAATPEPTEEPIVDVMVGPTLEAEYAADFDVSNVFSDDMVVQRGEHLRIWGTAPESENGKKVSGSFKGMFAEAIWPGNHCTLVMLSRPHVHCLSAYIVLFYQIFIKKCSVFCQSHHRIFSLGYFFVSDARVIVFHYINCAALDKAKLAH